MERKTEVAVFGGGCFWCTEAVFEGLRDVLSVVPGYAGGEKENPTYEQISSGKTGHTEVIRIEFDPHQTSYKDLLTVFFATHDPTTPNRQGADIGTQYRSIILYTTKQQKQVAEVYIKSLNESLSKEGKSVVTEVKPLTKFFEAEDYHKKYYQKNPSQPYCQMVITPKILKLQEQFAKLLKSQNKT